MRNNIYLRKSLILKELRHAQLIDVQQVTLHMSKMSHRISPRYVITYVEDESLHMSKMSCGHYIFKDKKSPSFEGLKFNL
jgi:hypothetical protein